MADDFRWEPKQHVAQLRRVIEKGTYFEVFDLVQWLLKDAGCPINPSHIRGALEKARAAYRLLDDGETIVPITTEQEAQALNRAFADLATQEFDGARSHLREAARLLTSGIPADSIRESIHAVESVARAIGGTDKLSGALQALRTQGSLHPALEKAFGSLYGYASDEQGIRHPLIDAGAAAVDETDAIFMIGACASFVSYMISKRRLGAAPSEA